MLREYAKLILIRFLSDTNMLVKKLTMVNIPKRKLSNWSTAHNSGIISAISYNLRKKETKGRRKVETPFRNMAHRKLERHGNRTKLILLILIPMRTVSIKIWNSLATKSPPAKKCSDFIFSTFFHYIHSSNCMKLNLTLTIIE